MTLVRLETLGYSLWLEQANVFRGSLGFLSEMPRTMSLPATERASVADVFIRLLPELAA